MEEDCFFCKINEIDPKIIAENDMFFSRYDDFPVNKGHCFIFPKTHFESFFDMTPQHVVDFHEILMKTRDIIKERFNPDGFNMGVNEGEAAGRTIHHFHWHIIPRFKGDVENPRGGIRNIIQKDTGY